MSPPGHLSSLIHNDRQQSNISRKEVILQNIISKICNSLMNKDSRINSEYLLKVTTQQVSYAMQNQKLVTPKDISDLEDRILKIITKEENIIQNKSIFINQKHHYLSNMEGDKNNHSNEDFHQKSKQMIQSPFNFNKNTLLAQTSYQKSFTLSQNPNQQVIQATPQSTSLWFKDFGVQDSLKNIIQEQHRQEISDFLKFQVRNQENEMMKNFRNDQLYIGRVMSQNREQRNQERVDSQKRKQILTEESRKIEQQYKEDLIRLRQQKDKEYQLEQKLIEQNQLEIQRERMNNLKKKYNNINVQEVLKQQMNQQDDQMASQRNHSINHDNEFLSHIKTNSLSKSNTLRSGTQIQGTNNKTLLDHFFHNRDQPHKSYELAQKNQVFSDKMLEQLEKQHQDKMMSENSRLQKYQSEIALNQQKKDEQAQQRKREMLKIAQEMQKKQMIEKKDKVKVEVVNDKARRRLLERDAVDYGSQEIQVVEQQRSKERDNRKLVKEQIKEQTIIRLNESIM
ncbi:UNKNOWN [Stylonychia lemnae]|uniref:Uncharacterized protein n=1 Tax=Stylonychia lemnae TaxID=5949 RepID=A0A078BC75_STYLE|nr:UNKNOWN [Stylonychia lemnae]|eukprot:CDW91198.1 UNKNOWN [Stylonychia lemnae]